jgi:hypothetical protein
MNDFFLINIHQILMIALIYQSVSGNKSVTACNVRIFTSIMYSCESHILQVKIHLSTALQTKFFSKQENTSS